MPNMLIEKRNELLAARAKLEADRKTFIDNKVEAYRIALEAQTPAADIAKIDAVIKALDEVIAYDNELPVKTTVEDVQHIDVKEDVPVEAATEVKTEAVQDMPNTPELNGRPGMSNIFMPTR